MVDEAEDMMLNGIMRGKLNSETGNYEVKVKSEHADSMESDKTNIEPITSETANKLSSNPKVEITSSSCISKDNTSDMK